MLTADQVADLVGELVEARLGGDNARVVTLLHGLVTGQRGDALNVALMMAGIMAMDLGDEPEMGFHWIEVKQLDADGRLLPGSTTDLPPHVAVFVQMVVAIANGERDTARDLFLGFVQNDGRKALALLALMLKEVMHQNGICPTCDPAADTHTWLH